MSTKHAIAVGLLGALLVALRCSITPAPGNDAGADALGPCTTNADCPSGTACRYPVDGGCSAAKECIPQDFVGCKARIVCACDGTQASVCNGATKPIAFLGECEAGCTLNSGGDCGSGLACENCDVTGYTPVTMGTPTIHAGACSAAELQAFVTACFSSGATTQTCDAWKAQDGGACGACLAPTTWSSSSWGPFACATANGPCDPNSGGCVDLVLGTAPDAGTHTCGDVVASELGCLDYTCETCSSQDAKCCRESAQANECKSWVDATKSLTGPCATLDADAAPPAAAECFPQSDADNLAFVNIFCGTGP